MNFQTLPPVPPPKELLDLAFGKAREKGRKKLEGDHLTVIRTRESLKLDVIKYTLVQRLQKVLDDFPDTKSLPVFYQKMLDLTLDYALFKKSLGAVNWCLQKIRVLHRDNVRRLAKERKEANINPLAKQFYGRVSSLLKQIKPNLEYLDQSRKVMKMYPDIKEMFTACIYGFPNVGKSTLLNTLAGSKAKVAAYAFTTLVINAGYIAHQGKKIQLLDVPGTLAREKKNNVELIAELVVQELADVIIYVFDMTEFCGYTIEQQKDLLERISKRKKVFVYLSKLDILDPAALASWKKKYYTLEELRGLVFSLVEKEIEQEHEDEDELNEDEHKEGYSLAEEEDTSKY